MTYEAGNGAILARFNTVWGTTTPIKWPNASFTPPVNGAWVAINIIDADAFNASFGDPGNNLSRHLGTIAVMIFTPLNTGNQLAYQLADQAAAVFRNWTDVTTRVKVRVAPFVRPATDQSERKWFQMNMVVPFERDDFV
jgi:hypothetical protein